MNLKNRKIGLNSFNFRVLFPEKRPNLWWWAGQVRAPDVLSAKNAKGMHAKDAEKCIGPICVFCVYFFAVFALKSSLDGKMHLPPAHKKSLSMNSRGFQYLSKKFLG